MDICIKKVIVLIFMTSLFGALKCALTLDQGGFCDPSFLSGLAFLLNTTGHLIKLNTKLRGRCQFLNVMYEHGVTFWGMLCLCNTLDQGNLDHFPILQEQQSVGVSMMHCSLVTFACSFMIDLKTCIVNAKTSSYLLPFLNSKLRWPLKIFKWSCRVPVN